MPAALPDFGIDPTLLDPALLSATIEMPEDYVGQPGEPAALDPVGKALAALEASGALGSLGSTVPINPALYGGGAHDTDLGDPADPESMTPSPVVVGGRTAALAGLQAGTIAVDPAPVHLPPGTPKTQQRYPTKAQEAQIQRQYLLDDPSRQLAPTDVQGFEYREAKAMDNVLAKKRAAASAEVLAQQDQALRTEQALKEYNNDVQLADSMYQQMRGTLRQKNELEATQWLQEYQAKAAEEPNPDRWWENRSGLGKALWALGMVFGAAHVAVTPGAQNVALNMAMQNIQQDVQLQKERLGRELEGMKLKGQVMDRRHLANLTDAADDHSMELARLQNLKQAYLARAAAPGQAGMQSALAAADAWFAQQEAALATKKVETAVQRDEAQLNRRHQTYLDSLRRNLQWNMQSREIAKDYDLAELSAKSAVDKAKAGAQADLRGVPTQLGAKMVNSPLGENIQVHKEEFVKMTGVFEAANRRYDALQRVRKALEDGSFAGRMVTGDPELRAAAAELGYTTGKELDPQGRLSDQDVKWATTINIGFDPSNGVFDKARFEANVGEIKKMVNQQLLDLPSRVSNQANTYLDSNLVGEEARVLWTPKSLQVTPPELPTLNESFGLTPPTAAPTDVADFKRKQVLQSTDPMFKGTLPQYDEAAVVNFHTAVQGASPSKIRAAAEKALEAYKANSDPWSGPVEQDSPGKATTRLAIESSAQEAIKAIEPKIKEFRTAAKNYGVGQGFSGKPAPTLGEIADIARKGYGLYEAQDEVLKAYEDAKAEWKRTHQYGLKAGFKNKN